MKKTNIYISIILSLVLLSSCSGVDKNFSYVNGEKVDNRFIYSGYLLDKASMSNAAMSDALDRVIEIEKPTPLGTVELPDLTKIEITTAPIKEVSNEDVEANIEQKRDNDMEYKTVKEKRAVKSGDKVVIDAETYIDNQLREDMNMKNQAITVGSGEFIKEFEEKLIGHKVGEDAFDIYVKMPNDIEDNDLKGKMVKFSVLINYIQEPITPELDSDFIKFHTMKGATNSDAYRVEVREILEAKAAYQSVQDVQNKLLQYLLENSKCTPSEMGLAWKFSRLLMEQRRLAEIQDIDFMKQLTNGDQDIKQCLQNYKLQSSYVIVKDMILDKIADIYDVKVGEDEKHEWFNKIKLVNEYGSDVDYRLYHNSMGDAYVYDNAYQDKVLTELMKNITIKYEEAE